MTYRKRKKQCKRRLEKRQRLTESQRHFCRKHKLTGYLVEDMRIGFSKVGKTINDNLVKVTKSLATALNELGEHLYAAFSKIDWKGIYQQINRGG